jgi:glycosyltransferase involved in cell wall biosynthesis
MNILFVHQNFPGQFKHLAPALARDAKHRVLALTMQKTQAATWEGIELVPYGAQRHTARDVHPWAAEFETKVIRGEACFRAATALKERGFSPDVIVAHPGWGESLFVKDVWPAARLGIYCEFFYHSHGLDVGFDPEFPGNDPDNLCRVRMKNANNLLHMQIADGGLAPTHWQASTFPEPFRQRIAVAHDGIDTQAIKPAPQVQMTLSTATGPLGLTRASEIVTFVSRNLEPYRGYHIFMRALPQILASRPNARVLILGGGQSSYGAAAPGGRAWKDIFIDEVRGRIAPADWARVHFLGKIPYPQFIALLQLSTVHVYLTYPFVLSWSLLEAMSAQCAIVASNTAPVLEAIRHEDTGRLVDFFDAGALAREVCSLLEDPNARTRLGANARAFAVANYDLRTICLPRQLGWVESLTEVAATPP